MYCPPTYGYAYSYSSYLTEYVYIHSTDLSLLLNTSISLISRVHLYTNRTPSPLPIY